MSTGIELRDQGVEAVLAADHSILRDYKELAREAIDDLVELGKPFDAETVRERVAERHPDAEAHSQNVLPGCFAAARAQGRIRAVGWTQPTRPSRHGSWIRTWIGATR